MDEGDDCIVHSKSTSVHSNDSKDNDSSTITTNKRSRKNGYKEQLKTQLASCYTNRAACLEKLQHYMDAKNDCRDAIRVDPNFLKAVLREARLYLQEGNLHHAMKLFNEGHRIDAINSQKVRDQALQVLERFERSEKTALQWRNKRNIHTISSHVLQQSVQDLSFVAKVCTRWRIPLLYKAELLYAQHKNDESFQITSYLLQKSSVRQDPFLLLLRVYIWLGRSQPQIAKQELKTLLKWDPDHPEGQRLFHQTKTLLNRKSEADGLYKQNQYDKAVASYTEAIEACPVMACPTIMGNLYYNRAASHRRLHKLQETIQDCTLSIQHDPNNVKAYLRRAQTYLHSDFSQTVEQRQQHCTKAVEDYEKALKLSREHGNRDANTTNNNNDKSSSTTTTSINSGNANDVLLLLRKAVLELRKVSRQDHYRVLGIARNATQTDVKRRYFVLARQYHPDRQQHSTPLQRKRHAELFPQVNLAYQTLSDPEKRDKYDKGGYTVNGSGGVDDDDSGVHVSMNGKTSVHIPRPPGVPISNDLNSSSGIPA